MLSTSPFETGWTSCPAGPRILLSWLPPCWNYRCMLSLNSCILHGCWGSEPGPQISLASTLSITLSLPERVSEIQGSHCRCSHLTDEKLRPRPLTLEALCYPSQAITNISTSLGCRLCSECFCNTHLPSHPPWEAVNSLSSISQAENWHRDVKEIAQVLIATAIEVLRRSHVGIQEPTDP